MIYPTFQEYFDELAALKECRDERRPIFMFVAARKGRACGLRAHRVHFDLTEQFPLEGLMTIENEIAGIIRKVFRMGDISDTEYYAKIAFQAVNDADAMEGAYELPE